MTLAINLTLSRGRVKLAVDCQLPSQGVTALYGHSGAGKTSLLRCIAGLECEAQGSVCFNSEYWQTLEHHTPCHQRCIGYVFQDARLFPHLNVLGNLHYAVDRTNTQHSDAMSLEYVCEYLKLTPLLQQYPDTLSGGEQQRVAIGRMLLSQPQLILMDEPLSALDQQSRDEVLLLLEQLPKRVNVPIIYISHNMDEVSRLADQLVIMEHGKITTQGTLIELCHQLNLSINQQEQAASIIEGHVSRYDSHYQLAQFLLPDGQSLFLQTSLPPNSQLRLRIPARDISLTLNPHTDSSILNILTCRISDIKHDSTAAHALIKLQLGSQFLLARITHKSLDHLRLALGQTIYAQIKSVALLNKPLEN